MRPAISGARRFGNSRTEAGTWSINENVVVRIARSPLDAEEPARRALIDPKSRRVNAVLTLTGGSSWRLLKRPPLQKKNGRPEGRQRSAGRSFRRAAAKSRRAPQI